MSGHDRNVTASTTGSSKQNRPENGTELLAGLPSPERIAEIRARLDEEQNNAYIGGYIEFNLNAADDIAWLLEQVEELTKRVRMYEVVKS